MVAWDQYAADVGVVFPPAGEDEDVEDDYHALEPHE